MRNSAFSWAAAIAFVCVVAGAFGDTQRITRAGIDTGMQADQPGIVYSTYLGSNGNDAALDVAVDSEGNAYVLGITTSTNFPASAASGSTYVTFVTKVSSDGKQVLYSRIVPHCTGRGIAVNANGEAIIAGSADDALFVTSSDALQTNFNGGTHDGFLARLSKDGSNIVYSTFLGGEADDFATDVALDAAGNVCVAGFTFSTNFLVTANAAQRTLAGLANGFVLKLGVASNMLLFSTYLGGSRADGCIGIASDANGNTVVTGWTISTNFPMVASLFEHAGFSDTFITKLDSAGRLTFSSYLGGSGTDFGSGVAVSSNGRDITVLGITRSVDFPTVAAVQNKFQGAYDNFVARISTEPAHLVFSTYFGGSGVEGDQSEYASYSYQTDPRITSDFSGIAVDNAGHAYVASSTDSSDFPATNGLTAYFPGESDAYVAKFAPNGALIYATALGGSGADKAHAIAVQPEAGIDLAENVYVVGTTDFNRRRKEFPTTPGAFQPELSGPFTNGYAPGEAFVTRLARPLSASPNDNFSERERFALAGTRWTTLGANFDATAEPGEPAHAGGAAGKSVWWSWKAPVGGQATITTEGSSFETILAVYTGSSLTNLSLVSSAVSVNSKVQFSAQPGETYSIVVDGNDGASGHITLTLNLGIPSNDAFTRAILLMGAPVRTNGSNAGATLEEGEHDSVAGGRSVWYRWAPPTNGVFAAQVSQDYFEASVRISTNSSLERLTFLSGERDTTNAVFRAYEGRNYQILVDGPRYSRTGGSGPFTLSIVPVQGAPNDDFATATELSNRFSFFVSGNNVNATREDGEPDLTQLSLVPQPPSPHRAIYGANGSSLWWRWVAPTNGQAILRVTSTDFQPIVAIFSNSPPRAANVSAALTVNEDATNTVSFPIVEGTEYLIMVDGRSGSGTFDLGLSVATPPKFQISASSPRIVAGAFEATGEGVIGETYQVQVTTNLNSANWLPIGNFSVLQDIFELRDTNLIDRMRLYRAVRLPP